MKTLIPLTLSVGLSLLGPAAIADTNMVGCATPPQPAFGWLPVALVPPPSFGPPAGYALPPLPAMPAPWAPMGYRSGPPTVTDPAASRSASLIDTDQDDVFDDADLCPDTVPVEQVDRLGCSTATPIVLEGVHFETDSDRLTGESTLILDRVASTLSAHPELQVEIAGHTDSDADDAYNLTLSQRRADAVVGYLADQGVARDHMLARGYGESQPLFANDSSVHKAANRRVELRRQ